MKTKKKQTESSEVKHKQSQINLFDLYNACMKNAYSLADEAKLLLKHGHYPRAFFLALTAYEEIGKAQLTADYINDCVSVQEFERAFRDHDIKVAYNQRNISLSIGKKGEVISETLEYDLKKARSFIETRMKSLYVCKEGTSLKQPCDIITKETATEMIDDLGKELHSIEFAIYLNDRIGSKGLFK